MPGDYAEPMPNFEVVTAVAAPPDQVFAVCLDVQAHTRSMASSSERAVDGRTRGELSLGDTVTFQARHFGLTWRLKARITSIRPAPPLRGRAGVRALQAMASRPPLRAGRRRWHRDERRHRLRFTAGAPRAYRRQHPPEPVHAPPHQNAATPTWPARSKIDERERERERERLTLKPDREPGRVADRANIRTQLLSGRHRHPARGSPTALGESITEHI